jgi:hypothetical protein
MILLLVKTLSVNLRKCLRIRSVWMVEDGSSVMIDSKNGVVWRLSGKLGSKIHEFHCIIHWKVLCGKC